MGEVITLPAWKRAERSPVGRVAVGPSSNRPILPTPAQPLWREVIGSVLRDQRHGQHRTLAQVAARAGMSVQYLSEVERGRKEASSEMLAAVCGSLGISLGQFAFRCAGAVDRVTTRPPGPVLLAG